MEKIVEAFEKELVDVSDDWIKLGMRGGQR